MRDAETLRDVVRRLEAAGSPVEVGSGAEADERRVQAFVTTQDPSGTVLEIFHGAALRARAAGDALRGPLRHR